MWQSSHNGSRRRARTSRVGSPGSHSAQSHPVSPSASGESRQDRHRSEAARQVHPSARRPPLRRGLHRPRTLRCRATGTRYARTQVTRGEREDPRERCAAQEQRLIARHALQTCSIPKSPKRRAPKARTSDEVLNPRPSLETQLRRGPRPLPRRRAQGCCLRAGGGSCGCPHRSCARA